MPDVTENEIIKAYKDTFLNTSGQIVLDDMRFSFHDIPLIESDPHGLMTGSELAIYREGQRSVYLQVVSLVEIEVDDE